MVYRKAGCWLHQCVLRNTLAGSKTVVSTSRNPTVHGDNTSCAYCDSEAIKSSLTRAPKQHTLQAVHRDTRGRTHWKQHTLQAAHVQASGLGLLPSHGQFPRSDRPFLRLVTTKKSVQNPGRAGLPVKACYRLTRTWRWSPLCPHNILTGKQFLKCHRTVSRTSYNRATRIGHELELRATDWRQVAFDIRFIKWNVSKVDRQDLSWAWTTIFHWQVQVSDQIAELLWLFAGMPQVRDKTCTCQRAATDISLKMESQVCTTKTEIPLGKPDFPISTTVWFWGWGGPWVANCSVSIEPSYTSQQIFGVVIFLSCRVKLKGP